MNSDGSRYIFVAALEQEVAAFEAAGHECIVTGPGKVNMAVGTMSALFAYNDSLTTFVNVGTAGMIGVNNLDHTYEISVVKQHDLDTNGLWRLGVRAENRPIYVEPLRAGWILATGDQVILDRDAAAKIHADTAAILVDMEGYAFAAACTQCKASFRIVKHVSDHANEDAHRDFQDCLEDASFKLLEWVERNILVDSGQQV